MTNNLQMSPRFGDYCRRDFKSPQTSAPSVTAHRYIKALKSFSGTLTTMRITTRPHLTLHSLLHKPTKKPTILQTNMSTATTTKPPSKVPEGASAMQKILESSYGEDWQQFLIETMRSISAPLAQRALAQVGLGAGTTPEPYRLLEQGCGMGVVAPLLHETVPREVQEKSSVLCGDFSAPLVEAVKGRITKEGWVNCEAQVVDAQVSVLPLFALRARRW